MKLRGLRVFQRVVTCGVMLGALPLTALRADDRYHATIDRTTAGVPHIRAADMGSLGYGYGYAFAEDNVCPLLEEIVTVRGERAKFFGEQPYDLGNTAARSNVKSDAVYRMLATPAIVHRMRAELDDSGQALIRGYARGVSRFVRELREGAHPNRHQSCRSAPWLREISDEDLYLRMYKLTLLSSSLQFIDGIAAAQPPAAPTTTGAFNMTPGTSALALGLARAAPHWDAAHNGELGSNMYAFGRDVTGGSGIVFGNPHFPWYGAEKFHQVHLTIPGVLDVQGGAIYGLPVVNIGFTGSFAWSHTTSYAHRFTPYALALKPGDPLTYLKDGVEKRIEAVDIGVEVLRDGAMQTESVRLYRSEYGPMVQLGPPPLGWGNDRAITIRDANAENLRVLRQLVRWNMAKSLDEFVRIQREELATPWVNTVAADREGHTYYADLSVVPNVPNELAARCAVPGISEVVEAAIPRLPLLDGARSECAWKIDPSAPQPGILGADALPRLERNDWVLNCNDSHWLTNPKALLEGFPRIVNDEQKPQSLRSRLCHQQVLDRIAGRDGLPGTQVTHEAVENIVLGSRIYSAELEKARVLEHVCGIGTIRLERDPLTQQVFSPPVEVATDGACAALAAWDDRNNADSRGSLLWDEFWFRVEAVRAAGVEVYAVPFDPAAPIDTPRALDFSRSELAQAFAAAVNAVQQSGFAFDVPRRELSYRQLEGASEERIAIPGGFQRSGAFTIAQPVAFSRGQRPELRPMIGYGPTRWGNSYLQVVSFPHDGSVRASTFVTYGQSSDPASPYYCDYTRRYAGKRWVHASFSEAEIAADRQRRLELRE